MSRMWRHGLCGAVVIALALSFSSAAARPDRRATRQARQLFYKGNKQYRLGSFEKALELFRRSLEQANRPNTVFNIAQCHRQLKKPEKALFNYKLYLSEWERVKPGSDPPHLGEVKTRIAELEAKLERDREAQRRREETARKERERKARALREAEQRRDRAAVGAEPPPRSLTWPKIYGAAGILLSFYGWGNMTPTEPTFPGDIGVEPSFMGGVHLAGYYAVSNVLHIGGYFSLMGGDGAVEETERSYGSPLKIYSVGASMKVGGTAGQRLWIGGALDLGGAFFDIEEGVDEMYKGVVIFPRFQIDVLIVGGSGFKLALFGCLGSQIYPYLGGEYGDGPAGAWDRRSVRAWVVQVSTMLGVTMGG